jgi:hypothetical protein
MASVCDEHRPAAIGWHKVGADLGVPAIGTCGLSRRRQLPEGASYPERQLPEGASHPERQPPEGASYPEAPAMSAAKPSAPMLPPEITTPTRAPGN